MTSLLACFCVFVSSFLPSLKDKRCLKLFISLRREASIQEDLDKTKKCVSFRTKGRWHQTLLVFKESLSNDFLLRSLPTPVPEPGCAEVNAHSISALILGLARAMAKGLYEHVLATCEDSSGDELGAEPGSAQEAWPGRSHGVGSGQAPGAPPRLRFSLSIATGSGYLLHVRKGDFVSPFSPPRKYRESLLLNFHGTKA